MKITFHGAARTVTGSMHLVETGGGRFLLDCGLFQGRREEARLRNAKFPFDAGSIDAVVLSHAHIDHSGNLPNLVKAGFKGRIHATRATADLARVMLMDSAHIQVKDTEFINKRLAANREPLKEPLYEMADVEKTIALLAEEDYEKPFDIVAGARATFHDAGHILGSAITEIKTTEKGTERRLVFTGDLGRKNIPILRDPVQVPEADVLIMESTYGNRSHGPPESIVNDFAETTRRVIDRKGKILVPAFAVGRTQEIVHMLKHLIEAGRLPGLTVHVDSPLAVDVTGIYSRHPECFDEEVLRDIKADNDPFGFRLLHYIHDVEESKKLNITPGPYMVVSASGMCEAGRILHHLANGIGDPKNLVLIVGYQAEHTLGRRLVEQQEVVRIFGEEYTRRAEVKAMTAFSAHADRDDLDAYVRGMRSKPSRTFLVHGEIEQSFPLRDRLAGYGIPGVSVPEQGETVNLF